MYQQRLIEKTVNGWLVTSFSWQDGVPPVKVHLDTAEAKNSPSLFADLVTYDEYLTSLKARVEDGEVRV